MNVAQKQTETQVPSKHPIITEFYTHYEAAIEQARLSSLVTETERWKGIYHEHRRNLIRARKEIAGAVSTLAELLEQRGWTEENEKSAKDSIKDAVSLREAETHWRRQTLDKITSAVESCEAVRRDALNKATSFATSQPMFGQQVLDELRRVMAVLPKASFDEETGCVIVADQT